MKILLAGASGVAGQRLVPRMRDAGHDVVGLTRSAARVAAIRASGAEAVVCDVLDARRVDEVVRAAKPEVVVQHLTDLPKQIRPGRLSKAYVGNDRLREQGTRNLVRAAEESGVRRYVAQNVCFFYRPDGGPVKDETAPLYLDAPPPFDRTARVYREMEERILCARPDGLVLRFGFWYGPGTAFSPDGYFGQQVRRRRVPVVGDGAGLWPFVHVDDVVEATIAAVERGAAGVYNVADDEPAPMREWLPAFAAALGAKPPRRVPAWLARLAVGRFETEMMTRMRGASNAKARSELGWSPLHPSWRTGFRDAAVSP